jgi:hypothetical protein
MVVLEYFLALLPFSHSHSKSYGDARTDRPALTNGLGPRSVPVDRYGHLYNFCYVSVKKSKVLRTFLTQPCGSRGTLIMTPMTDMALLQYGEEGAIFQTC